MTAVHINNLTIPNFLHKLLRGGIGVRLVSSCKGGSLPVDYQLTKTFCKIILTNI